ncbi:MAG: zinc-ribbon domain-containing protein [Methanomassiliicoccales archaeon]|nr:zinc-ribbon domain-containing protein [Methanomassiliicoccales archaeon]
MSPAGDLRKKFEEFKGKKYAIPIGLVLTIAVTTLLLVFLLDACLSVILIAILAYAIPFYFGLKNRKRLALFGLALFIFLGFVFAATVFYAYTGYPGDHISSEDSVLVNGTVNPYKADASATFTYSVMLAGGNESGKVWANISSFGIGEAYSANQTMEPYEPTPIPGGQVFVLNKTMPAGVYAYHFASFDGTSWHRTSIQGLGPLSLADDAFFGQLLYQGMIRVWLQIATLFYMIIVLTWWMDNSKKRAGELRKQAEEGKKKKDAGRPEKGKEAQTDIKKKIVEKLVCSECGAEVPADAKKCPQCGEPFEEEAELICTSCGAKVKESDKKCWNCGKEFEN